MERVIQCLETAPVMEVGRVFNVTRPVLDVVSRAQDVTMETDHVIKPQGIASVFLVTRDPRVWKRAVQVSMEISASGSAIV